MWEKNNDYNDFGNIFSPIKDVPFEIISLKFNRFYKDG